MLEKTLHAIDSIVARLNTHPDYSAKRKTHVFGAVRAEASRHSVGIEFKVEQSRGKVRRKRREASVRHLEKANKYLAKHGITLGTLSMLGHLVEPEGQQTSTFRMTQVQFARFSPPPGLNRGDHIYRAINDLVEILNGYYVHPVTRAVEAHIEMVKIHPYEDGNGRAARLLQNFCLEQKAYPPALIHAEDREVYLKLIGKALDERYAMRSSVFEVSDKEKPFHEFIAAKVLDSASKIEHELRNRHMYSVEFCKNVDRDELYSMAKNIRNRGRRDTSRGVSVRMNKKGVRPGFEVTGVIDVRELRAALDNSNAAKKAGYDIKKV